MNTNENLHNSDEIDLRDLVLSIWEGRWFISLFVVAAMLLGVVFMFLTSDRFKAEVKITPISALHFDAYRELNSLDFISVGRDSLLTRFIEQVEDSDMVYDVFRQHMEQGERTDEEYEEFLINRVQELVIENLTDPEVENSPVIYQITYSGRDDERFRSIIEQILSTANRRVWTDLNQLFTRQINTIETNQAYELRNLENSIESRRVLYNKNLEARLAFLKEQSTIAHTLGLKHNAISGDMVSLGAASLAAIEKETPEYFRGYTAIDKEIELLSSRKNDEAFIPGVPELRMKINEIHRDTRIERIKLAMEASPLSDESSFYAATYDLKKMEVKSQFSKVLVLALAIILGGMLGVFALAIRNILRSDH